MTDITHTPYTTKARRAGLTPPSLLCSVSCLLRITTLWSQTAIPHTGLERAARTKRTTHETNCTFFKCKRTKLEFVNIMFVVWFE